MFTQPSFSPPPALEIGVLDPLATRALQSVLTEVDLTVEQCHGNLDESLIDSFIDKVAHAFCTYGLPTLTMEFNSI